jgi:hypothetical protein
MSRNEWLELVQLAEILCPMVLLDLPVLMELEAYGLLLWLRRKPRAVVGAAMKAPRLTGARCRCSACGDFFNSVSTFDRHRVGGWSDHGAHRRCLTADQMVVRGWQRNAQGFWIERQRLDGPRRSGVRRLPLPLVGALA